MMLTKEECEKALRNICETVIDSEADGHNQPRTVSDYCFSETDILKQLIQEHFDNPPLSFDELEKGMWVWDDFWKKYRRIIRINKDQKSAGFEMWSMKMWSTNWVDFEENRFYRRQKEG